MKNIRNVSNNLIYRVQKTENKPGFHYTKKKKQMFITICLPRAPNDLVYQTLYIQLTNFMFHMHLSLTYLYLQKMHLETLILTMHSAITLFMGIDTRLLIILHPWCLNCMQVYKIDPFFLSFSQTTFLCCSGICMLFVDDTIGGTTMKSCWVNKHDAISSILCPKRQFCHQKKIKGLFDGKYMLWWDLLAFTFLVTLLFIGFVTFKWRDIPKLIGFADLFPSFHHDNNDWKSGLLCFWRLTIPWFLYKSIMIVTSFIRKCTQFVTAW